MLAAVAACAPAHPPKSESPKPELKSKRAVSSAPTQLATLPVPKDARIAEIWEAASDRLDRQQDVWFDAGDFPVVVQSLRVQASLRPSDYEVWTNLGWMQENIELYEDALATYIRFRNLNPTDPDRALPEAVYYDRKRLYAKIPSLLEPVLTQKSHPNNFRLLARAYERQGMLKDSKRVWDRYIAIAPADLTAKVNLARVERKLAGS